MNYRGCPILGGHYIFLVTCDVSADTRRQARAHCAEEGIRCCFWAGTELDKRVKQHADVVEEFFRTVQGEVIKPTWWTRFRRHPLVFFPTIIFTTVAAIVTLLATLITIGADIGGARQQFLEWGLIRAFPPEREDETLIVIASFYHPEGIPDTEPHNEICRAIQRAKEDLGLSNLRVEVEPTRLHADERDGAEELGKRYSASMIIWGTDTGVRVAVTYLNLKHPDLKGAEVQISETARTQLANPTAYAEFVTHDLPEQLTFLSLFAIGETHFIEGAYADSLEVIQKAVDSLAPATEPPEGLGEAYARLGYLHQVAIGDDQQAIANYDRAIALIPNFPWANYYLPQVVLRSPRPGVFEVSTTDDDPITVLIPEYSWVYVNRGAARAELGDLEGAIADFDQAIALRPSSPQAYLPRGAARAELGDLEGAIADFDRAIALSPDSAEAYNNRGNVRYSLGDMEGAIADYDQAIALSPDYAGAYNNRGNALSNQGDLEGAIADYAQAIALDPGVAMFYYNRGVIYTQKGEKERAIADFKKVLELGNDSRWGQQAEEKLKLLDVR